MILTVKGKTHTTETAKKESLKNITSTETSTMIPQYSMSDLEHSSIPLSPRAYSEF